MTVSVVRKQKAVRKAAALILAFCLAFLLPAPAALAAPEDEQEEVIEIDLTEDQDAGSDAATRLVVNEDEELTDYTGGEDQAEEAAEEEREKTDTEPAAEMEEEEEPEEARNPGAFTVDGNGTIQDIIADGTKEFYVITTDNGGVFYLLIDRAGDIDNVYFLSAVDETDIQDFVKEPVSVSVNEETGTAATTVTTVSDESSEAETGTGTDTSENSSSSNSSYTGLIVLVVIVAAVIIIVLVRRSRKNRKNGGKPEEGSEDADPKDFYQDHDEDDEDI